MPILHIFVTSINRLPTRRMSPRKSSIGKPIFERLGGASETEREGFHRTVAMRATVSYEACYTRGDGTQYWAKVSWTPVPTAGFWSFVG